MRTRRQPPTAGEETCRGTRARDDGVEEAAAGGGGGEVAVDGAHTPQRPQQGARLSRQRRGEARTAASQLGRMARANIMSSNAHCSAVLESGLAAHTSTCSESEHDISWNPLSPSQGPTAERRGAWLTKTNVADIIKKLKPVVGAHSHEVLQSRNKRRRVECRELHPEELVSMAKDIDRASRDGNNAPSTVCSERVRSPPQHGNATTCARVTTAFGADLPPQGSLHSATRLTRAEILRERAGIARRSENGREDHSTPTRILGTPVSSSLVIVSLPHELEPSPEPASEHASANSGDRPRPSQLTFCPPLQSTPKANGSGWQYEADLHALFDEDTMHPSHPLSGGGAVGTGSQDKLATASAAPSLAKKTACHSVQGLRCTSEAAQVLLAGDLSSCVIDAPLAGARARPLCYEPSGATDCAQRNKEVGSARPTNTKTGDTVLAFAEGAARDGVTAARVIPGSNLPMENVFDDWEDDDWMHDSSFIAVSSQLSDLVTNSELKPNAASTVIGEDEWDDLGNMDELLSRIREPVDGIWDKQSDIDPVNNECTLSESLTADCPPARADAKPSGSGASCGVAATAGAVCFEVSSGTCPTKQHSFKFVRTNNNSAVERVSDNSSRLSLLAQGGMGTRSAVGESGSALTIPHMVHLNTVLPSHTQSINMPLQARAAGGSEKASMLVPLSSVLPAGAQTFVSKPRASVVPPTRRLTVPEAAAACPGPPRIGEFQGRSGGATGAPPAAPGGPLNRSRSAFDILSTNSKPVLRRHYTDTTVTFTGGPKRCGPEEIERKRQEALDRRRQSASQQYATQRTTRPPIKLHDSQTNTKT
ncbi:unnamed protein product [Lampetra planeri]